MSSRGSTLTLATRGSDLALRQAATVQEGLADRRRDVDIVEVETAGDRIDDELIHRLGKTGAFVHSLDEHVLSGEADAAVHSLKDVPTEDREGLVVAAVPERGPAGDLLVSPEGHSLADLPAGATVGTSSLRRRAQLLAERPDLDVQPLRGNVDTRVEKLLAPTLHAEHEARVEAEEAEEADGTDDSDGNGDDDDGDDDARFDRPVEEWFDELSEVQRRALEREVETEYDAIVLAEAGMERLGLTHHVESTRLPPEQFVPSPGQGIIAVVAHEAGIVEHVHETIDDPRTRVEATVERTILAELGGGCVAPVGVRALFQGRVVTTTVRVLSPDGETEVADRRTLPVERHAEAAREMAADLADRGAADLIERARESAATEDGA